MKRLLLVLAAALTAFTCTDRLREEEPAAAVEEGLVRMSFRGVAEEVTKTSLDGEYHILWGMDDPVTVFAGENAAGQTFEVESVSDGGRSATFTGLAAVSPVYYALSPAQADATIKDGVISAVLPSQQEAVAGSFGAKANLSVARNAGEDLQFKNAGAIVGFKVGNEGITCVRLEGRNGEILTGAASVAYNDGEPSATVTDGVPYAELTGSFAMGSTYYFVVFPAELSSGARITFFKDGKKASFSKSTPLSIGRNDNIWFGEFTVSDGKWKDDFAAGDGLTVAGEGAVEAGQPMRYSTAFYNTSVSSYGDENSDLATPTGYDYEIFTQLSSGRKFFFQGAGPVKFALNAAGTAMERISSESDIAYAGTSRDGVFRIRFNSTTGEASIRRAESARYLQPAAKVNEQMTYEGRGVWKIENFAFGWLMKESWGNNERWKFKFQIYYNEVSTWQYYGLHTGASIQPVPSAWDWNNYLTVKDDPTLSGYQTEGEYLATVRLHLNAEDGYTYSFDDIRPTGAYSSLTVTSSEETFAMHKVAGQASLFEGVSTFTDGETVSMTATDIGGNTYAITTTATVSGPAYFVANPAAGSYTFTELPTLLAEGNAVNGFSNTSGATLSYAGAGVYSGSGLVFAGSSEGNAMQMTPTYPFSRNGRARFTFIKPGSSYSPMFRRLNGTRTSIENKDYGVTSEMQINPGTYDITVNLRDFTFEILPAHDGSRRITVMGSSVPTGTGATDNKGYMYLFGTNALTLGWTLSNISIPGDSTPKLLDRYDDLTADGGDYVVYALSLGNEGIHGAGDQQAVYNQWKTNMQTLISRARAQGKKVVVTGNYGRGDFNADDYGYVKAMNLEIHEWDVPSVNVLGAVDDEAGHWMSGYQNGDDAYHPNDAGHAEMSYTIVPSMFDAMAAGKALPARNSSGGMSGSFSWTPEATVHPFTVAFYINTTSGADILSVAGPGMSLNAATLGVNDGQWHLVALTHYYAKGITRIYVDGTEDSNVSGKMVPTGFTVSGGTVREIFFWRSAMTADEIAAVAAGRMLKSSLEIYAPLNGNINNFATSTNTINNL